LEEKEYNQLTDLVSKKKKKEVKRKENQAGPVRMCSLNDDHNDSATDCTGTVIRQRLLNSEKNIFDYFVFNIVDYICVNCGLPCSGARYRALAQTIGNARGLDVNSLRSAENRPQDLRFHQHQQHDDPNNARGLDNNFVSDRSYDSKTITRLPLWPRRPRHTR
jgi:hypothetical protein